MRKLWGKRGEGENFAPFLSVNWVLEGFVL